MELELTGIRFDPGCQCPGGGAAGWCRRMPPERFVDPFV